MYKKTKNARIKHRKRKARLKRITLRRRAAKAPKEAAPDAQPS